MPASPLFSTLISADDLLALMADGTPPIVVIETSFDLADTEAGERQWREAHLPGSFYLHLDRDLAGPKGDGRRGRHPLPDRSAFAATLARCGIVPATQVVAFDRQGGPDAARLWWMLRWMGHEAVAVLDGGMAAWLAAGGSVTPDVADAPTSQAYPLDQPPLAEWVDADALARRLGRTPLIDARAAERFRGEVEPLDSAAGHIPGARNRFFKDNLDATGRFKPAAELRAEFAPLIGAAGASQTVHQCGSGVTACHNLLAMAHAGLTGSVLYPGSWSEWSADPSRPVAVG